MEPLIISSLSVTLFCVALLLGKAGPSLADRILTIWLGLISINLGAVWVVEKGLESRFAGLLYLSECVGLLHGPVLWQYTHALTQPVPRLLIGRQGHLIPFGLAILLLSFLTDHPPVNQWLAAAGLLSVGGYSVAILYLLNHHEKNTEQLFSYVESVRLHWLRNTIYYLLIMLVIGLTSQLLFAFSSVQLAHYGNWYTNLFLTTVVWLISYHGVRQHAIFSPDWPTQPVPEAPQTAPSDTKYQNSGLKDEEAQRLLALVQTTMEQKRPYLDPELSLFKLAEYVGMAPHHLSQVINSQAGQNFFDFVNQYRVDALKDALTQGAARQFTLLALAYESGFNSKTSFNRAFKKFTGKTPQQYLSELDPQPKTGVQPIG